MAVGGMAGSGVAEDAEGQFVILRKDALRTQRGGDRDRPALGDLPQPRGSRIVLDTGTGQDGDPRLSALAIRQAVECRRPPLRGSSGRAAAKKPPTLT